MTRKFLGSVLCQHWILHSTKYLIKNLVDARARTEVWRQLDHVRYFRSSLYRIQINIVRKMTCIQIITWPFESLMHVENLFQLPKSAMSKRNWSIKISKLCTRFFFIKWYLYMNMRQNFMINIYFTKYFSSCARQVWGVLSLNCKTVWNLSWIFANADVWLLQTYNLNIFDISRPENPWNQIVSDILKQTHCMGFSYLSRLISELS